MLNVQDFPVLLVELLQNDPLSRHGDGKLQRYIDNKWAVVDDSDRLKITKTDGQVSEESLGRTELSLRSVFLARLYIFKIWLTLYKLIMDPDCQRKYEINSYRKNTLLKVCIFWLVSHRLGHSSGLYLTDSATHLAMLWRAFILKLRSHLNEVMLDQIPVLGALLNYLEHLSMMEPPAAKQDLILEQVCM